MLLYKITMTWMDESRYRHEQQGNCVSIKPKKGWTLMGRCFFVLTCFLRSLEICCSTMVISRSTRSMFCISSSFEKRAGTKSKSGSMWTGLTGEIGSSFPMALPRSCTSTSQKGSFQLQIVTIFSYSIVFYVLANVYL